MACNHSTRLRVYKRGPAPRYPFQPYGEVCPKCQRHLQPSATEAGVKS